MLAADELFELFDCDLSVSSPSASTTAAKFNQVENKNEFDNETEKRHDCPCLD